MKIMSVDVEVNGLYGNSFAIAILIREDGKEVFSWSGRCGNDEITDKWVRDNVLPAIESMPITHNSSEELEEAFWEQWMSQKEGCTVIAHMPNPVESGLFRRCVERNIDARQWDAPYPAIHDVATLLLMNGFKPDSVEEYAKKAEITCEFNGGSHHPMYDATLAAQVWEDLSPDL